MPDKGLAPPRGALFAATKGAVEAAKDWLLMRVENGLWLRSTLGNPDFSQEATIYYALAADSQDIDAANGYTVQDGKPVPGTRKVRRIIDGKPQLVELTPPSCAVPQLQDLSQFIANALAGHGGWETEKGIKAMEAAAEGKAVYNFSDERSRGRSD